MDVSIQPTEVSRFPTTKWGIMRRTRGEIKRIKRLGDAAIRQSAKINEQARRDNRKAIAAAELPAGRMARTNHRAAQIGELVAAVAAIVTGVVAIREALRGLQVPFTASTTDTSTSEPI